MLLTLSVWTKNFGIINESCTIQGYSINYFRENLIELCKSWVVVLLFDYKKSKKEYRNQNIMFFINLKILFNCPLCPF